MVAEEPDSGGPVLSPAEAVARTEAAVRHFEDTTVAHRATYTWEIRDWMALGARASSPVFACGGQRWQILLFPQGNPNGLPKTHVALYLEALGPGGEDEHVAATGVKRTARDRDRDADADDSAAASEDDAEPPQWPHTCASFALSMWNPARPDVHVTQSTNHRYRPKVCDWGYNEFTFLRSAFVRRPGEPAALIAPPDDSTELAVNITVAIDVLADPTGVLWHDFADYDSRAATGYTGLVNQGATCYLNSLLQSLYFTKIFRNAVYKIPDSRGVTGGMQRLFYMLSTSQPAVDTTSLTRAFGWDSADAFTQHDVQELARVLMDRLESKMKGTAVDGALSRIFVGEMKSYIKCLNVPFESSRTEEFWDVQLNVRGMRDVLESFRAYCAEERLEGDNQYAAGDYGLQDAAKGVVFTSFPPVLHLQLKRYDYDWMRDVEVKVNDRYEFPLELDLAPFTESKTGDWKYALHGVLVHSGDLNAGHYYALIKPNSDGGWFRFDDERVTKATLREVLEENFGGQGPGLRRITSAYMLVYIRVSDQQLVLGGPETIPPPIADAIEAEKKAEALRAQALHEQQQLMSLSIIDHATLKHHAGPGVLPWSSRAENELESPHATRVRLGTPIEKLSKDLGAGSLWLVDPNGGLKSRAPARPQLVPQGCYVEQLAQWSDNANPVIIAADAGDPATSRYVFIKTWDGEALKLREASWLAATSPLEDALDLQPNEQVFLETSTPTSRKPVAPLAALDRARTPEDLGLEPADILIVAGASAEGLEEYFEAAFNVVALLVFVEDVDNGGYEVEVSKQDDLATVLHKIGAAVGLDPERIQLHTMPSQLWRTVAIRSDGSNLNQLWAPAADAVPVRVRKLPVPLLEFEKLSEVVIFWLPDGHLGREQRREVLASPTSGCPSLVESIGRLVVSESAAESAPSQVLWAATYNRKSKELVNPTVGALEAAQAEGFDLFAAPLPPLEQTARQAKGSRLASAFHFAQTPARAHGVPFQFAIVPNELFSATKVRLFELLRREPDRGLEKIRFAIVTDSDVTYIGDDAVLYQDLPDQASLGLDHPDRRRSLQQQAIRID